ncbi:phage major capsid protein [Streptomyces sp. NBC_00885]|uniref:phage major capsid protein n=1 Tax=Streptomyces sp. NBC_00885 TaxID=2975857 RepID=UPI0038677D87|nr:phage major capsid protein [Streptomyces sp. NBC_00885]
MIQMTVNERREELVAEARAILARSDGALSKDDEERYTEIEGELKDMKTRGDRLAALRQVMADGRTERGTAEYEQRDDSDPGYDVEAERRKINKSNADLAKAFKSAVKARHFEPIDIVDPSPRSWYRPGVELRDYGKILTREETTGGGILTRDTIKSTATQALSTSVYQNVVRHLVENSSVMAAGATVVTTPTGEDLVVPKSTAFVSAALIGEGASITESDPTMAIRTMAAYKYASFWQLSRELADDTPTDLLESIAAGAGQALALAFGPHLVTGSGSGQPLGAITGSSSGVTGPTGTSVSLGTQATAAQGTDLLYDLVGSVAEPYARSAAAGFVMRNASLSIVRKLKASTGEPVTGFGNGGSPGPNQVLGWPAYVDPSVAAMAANAKSILFGDWSRYFVRIVNGIRVERSDEFAFQTDLASFKAVIRLDGAVIDAGALRYFTNSAT